MENQRMKKNNGRVFAWVLFTGFQWLVPAWADGLPTLDRGINLAHWLNYEGRQPMVKSDMVNIARAGFDHVRINVDPGFLGWSPDHPSTADTLPQFARLDAAIHLAVAAGLVVVLDMHPSENLKQRIENDPQVQQAFIDLWGQISRRYHKRPIGQIVYELLNEPQYWDGTGPRPWFELRAKLLAKVRQMDTRRLVLLSGSYGGGLRGLLENQVVDDAAIAYTFHYYEPMLLTHLGAPWPPFFTLPQALFVGLTYPAINSDWSDLRLKPGAPDSTVAKAFNNYQAEGWGLGRIRKDLQSAQQWASQNKVKVYCNEFGLIRMAPTPTVAETSRSAWLKDVSTALQDLSIGWTVFDYADIFGIAVATGNTYYSEDGAIVPNDPAHPARVFTRENLKALGMRTRQ
jgi:endoglucanase